MKKHILIILAIALPLFFLGLGKMALTDPDESFYAQTAKEMANTKEWVTPLIFGETQFEKPPLYYWLIKLSYSCFGVNEFSARFPSALLGLIGLLGIYFMGKQLFSPACGLYSSVVMATSSFYFILSRACVTDMALTVFILFTLLFFLLGWDKKNKLFYYLAAIAAGLSVLTKGPIGLLISGSVILIFLSTGKRWKNLKEIPIFTSILVFLAVAMPWYVLAYMRHGERFLSEFFGFQNLTRFIVPEHRIGDTPFFYLPVVLGGIFPWTIFTISGSVMLFKNKDTGTLKGSKVFLFSWFLFVLVFFSISRTKLVTYIFPLFPALAILTGYFFDQLISHTNEKTLKVAKMTLKTLLFLIVPAVLGGVIALKLKYPPALNAIYIGSMTLVPLTFLSYHLMSKDKPRASFVALVMAFILTVIPLMYTLTPIVGKLESSKYLSQKLLELNTDNSPIGGECDHRRGVAFYADTPNVENVHPYYNLLPFLDRPTRVWAIAQNKHLRQVKENRPDVFFAIAAQAGKYSLVTNKPLEQ